MSFSHIELQVSLPAWAPDGPSLLPNYLKQLSTLFRFSRRGSMYEVERYEYQPITDKGKALERVRRKASGLRPSG